MKTLRTSLIGILALAITFSACTKNYNEREIIGAWFSEQWLQEGQETGLKAWFDFEEDKTYRAVFGRTQEEGTWWIEGYKLYTRAYGQEQIVVKIERLEGDVLELGMNRGGNRELLIFRRAQ